MKRIVICAFIMVVVIIIGAVSYAYTDNAMDKAEKAVDTIAQSFSEGDFERTLRLTQRFSSDWREQYKSYLFIFDKEHIMELTAIISRIEALAEDENSELLVECKAASELIRLYRAKEKVSLSNIF